MHGYIEKTTDIFILALFPIFIITSIVSIVVPNDYGIKFIHKFLRVFVVWLIVMIVVGVIIFLNYKIRNYSKVIYSVEYFWKEGVQIEFRSNGTFKVYNEDPLNTTVGYGEYVKEDSKIIL